MRVMVLGGTRFIGAAILEELHAHGHELLVVHRGEHEPADLAEADHLHADRQDLPHLRGPVDEFDPEAVVDNCAYSAADAETALAAVGDDVRLLVVSSMDVYRAFGAVLAGTETDPLPVDETSPVRSERFPYRGRPHPSPDADTYEKLDVEDAYLARAATAWAIRSATRSTISRATSSPPRAASRTVAVWTRAGSPPARAHSRWPRPPAGSRGPSSATASAPRVRTR